MHIGEQDVVRYYVTGNKLVKNVTGKFNNAFVVTTLVHKKRSDININFFMSLKQILLKSPLGISDQTGVILGN